MSMRSKILRILLHDLAGEQHDISAYRKAVDAIMVLVDSDDTEKRVKELEELLRDFRDNYDCDEDAHKWDTPCRCCEAEKVLK